MLKHLFHMTSNMAHQALNGWSNGMCACVLVWVCVFNMHACLSLQLACLQMLLVPHKSFYTQAQGCLAPGMPQSAAHELWLSTVHGRSATTQPSHQSSCNPLMPGRLISPLPLPLSAVAMITLQGNRSFVFTCLYKSWVSVIILTHLINDCFGWETER